MKKIILGIFIVIIAIGCGKKETPTVIENPGKAMLSLPSQNEACTSGTLISSTQSTVLFKWEKSANTDSYEVLVKNLIKGTSTTHQTNANTQLELPLERNTPYSWSVKSKSTTNTVVTQSDTWKFYNSGASIVSHAPFPADALSPAFGTNIDASNGKISLNWSCSDVDNDISSYDVFLAETSNVVLLAGGLTQTSLANVSVKNSTAYYWKVVAKDSKGNSSETAIYQFKVN